MAAGVRKLPIGGLSPDVTNALIVAVLIAKQNYKTFLSKKGKVKYFINDL